MLKKKSLIIIVGLALFAAACNGPEDVSSFQDGQQVSGQVDQQVQQDQQAPQGQQQNVSNNPADSTAPQENTSNRTEVDTDNIAGQFADNVTVTFTDTFMVVVSDGLPSHEIPALTTPNTPTAQNYTFYIPLNPQLATTTTDTPMGRIGVALSGAVFYNGFTSDGFYAVELEILDHCGGHADGRGVYHYHEEGDCISGHLLGYAFDGFGIRISVESDGSTVMGLDVCNGHEHDGEYHYHATDDPSKPLLGCYSGIVETSNIVGGGGGGAPTGNQGADGRRGPGGGGPGAGG